MPSAGRQNLVILVRAIFHLLQRAHTRTIVSERPGDFALEGLDVEAGVSGVSSEANSTSNRSLPEVDVLKMPSYSSR